MEHDSRARSAKELKRKSPFGPLAMDSNGTEDERPKRRREEGEDKRSEKERFEKRNDA